MLKSKNTKVLSIVTALLMFVMMFPISSFAYHDVVTDILAKEPEVIESGEWTYTLLEDGTACVYGKKTRSWYDIIYNCAYKGSETSITIPEVIDGYKVTAIGESAFRGSNVQSIIIPNNIATIGDYAFYNCQALTSAYISGSVKEISRGAFANCSNLTDLTLCEGIETLGSGAFSGTGIKEFNLPKSLKVIREAALASNAIEEVIIPAGVEELDPEAAIGKVIKAINVDENNKYYSSENGILFNNEKTVLIKAPSCIELTEYAIPEGVEKLNYNCFQDVKNLTAVSFPNTLTCIDECSFEHCEKLKSIVIPANVKEVLWAAFSDCISLEEVTIEEGVEQLSSDVFANCTSLKSLYIPASLKIDEYGSLAITNCTSLEEVKVNPNNKYYSDIDGVLYNKEQTEMLLYPAARFNNTLVLPVTVESISDTIFEAQTPVEKVYCFNNSYAKDFASEAEIDYMLIGDLDGDANITGNDYSMVLSAVMCQSSLDNEQKVVADLNLDGTIDALDVIYIDLLMNGVI